MTSSTTWHLSAEMLRSYLLTAGGGVQEASVEAHLLGCAQCRALLAVERAGPQVRPALPPSLSADHAWERLVDTIDATPRRSSPVALSFLRPLLATPALVQATIVSAAVLALLPVLAALVAGEDGLIAVLIAAPLAPVAAVAVAFRPGADPAGEMGLATPASGFRLVALRAVGAALAALPMAMLGVAVLGLTGTPVPTDLATVWLLPGAALGAVTFAAGTTRLDPVQVAVALAAVWATGVTLAARSGRGFDVPSVVEGLAAVAPQAAAAALALAAVTFAVLRRDAVACRRSL